MSDQIPSENNEDEIIPIPPKGSTSGNKLLLIILGIVLAGMMLFGIILTAGFFYVKNRGVNIVKDIAKTQGVEIENIETSEDGSQFSVKTKDGEISTKSSNELPDDYPTGELPVYAGVITNTTRSKMGDVAHWMIQVETDDDWNAVDKAIQKDLEDNGWNVLMENKSQDTSTKSAKKGRYVAGVAVRKEDDGKKKTQINYTITQSKEETD